MVSSSILFLSFAAGALALIVPRSQDGLSVSLDPAGSLFSRQSADLRCGSQSPGGSTRCPLNVCCSVAGYCGTSDAYCLPSNGCQAGFGTCQVRTAPTCSAGAKSSNGRSIGYYQAVAARRPCDRVLPLQINTAGYTHLYFSFVLIDRTSFAITPADAADQALYSQFTALKSKGVQTWVAIGGGEFNTLDPNDPERYKIWSRMAASATSRAQFIRSLVSFMAQYGFQGADLDWEWPTDPNRGGSPVDTANYVSLVRELRVAFGTQYGLSMAIPADWGSMLYFDMQAMHPYLDTIGLMSYDLRSFEYSTDGLIRAQTDIRDITEFIKPLWYSSVPAAKINLGLASYGRGYTLRSSSCASLDANCGFTGPSAGGDCQRSPGVLSLNEINRIAAARGLTPRYDSKAMVKQLSWDNQWVGYDDAQTWAAKKTWADSVCIGGTMVWATDFTTIPGPLGGAGNPVTTDGRCGSAFGNAICGNWPDGNCCSVAGWCGSSSAHCGNGCQSGNCNSTGGGNVTTDGRCGKDFGNTVCGSWPDGGCCSSAGWCGSSTAHCGTGCQSGCS
ncbi:hypothetical protein MCOR27_003429 [Pyricularia oryzae]|uniref:chitinase n=4 Tax=Pyricularia TaxID=48558 RepID=A0ABQ8NIM5_PYRGI|nr:bacteriodes thetaiotaomicron symbiotic chitinase [Pyricularia oryzae 70-15]ELQ36476.1 bacteriodes thetaiotaomicron symbiotic chitinase [Pyricularia oryzae Y34]KAH8836835.1 hypothetical protein MCOR01_010495 [Pyricularia oryzae]KAI6297727.1 hypothetical protein MCOR33_006054 [Pyricularia grisea]EHA54455.1 bacteriodes thetaiotaomicron symbiotic chitinase [Pyricularia oryzae 70-15]KAH9438516.1 hypothetical protein MCOR02_002134 [Pyricularia oryzae]